MSVSLLKNERKAIILKQVNIHTRVTFSDLSNITNVSEDTIRRDLNELATEGKIIKVRGGAMISTYHPTAHRDDVYALPDKQIIAQKTISLFQDGMTVLCSGGTTIRAIARQLPDNLHITFFTVSPLIALELTEHSNVEVILLGGKLSNASKISIGGEVVSKINEIGRAHV